MSSHPHSVDTDQSISLPPGPVEGPFAWRGPKMAKRTDWIHTLSDSEIGEIEAGLRAAQKSGR